MRRAAWMRSTSKSKRIPTAVGISEFKQMLIDDVTLAHNPRPHGIPNYYDYYTYPIIHLYTPPSPWNAILGWGEVYEALGGNPNPGTRVELLNYETWIRSIATGLWTRVQFDAAPNGEADYEDYSGAPTTPARVEPTASGGVSVPVGGTSPPRNYHFWPNGRTTITPSDMGGVITLFRARWMPGSWDTGLPEPELGARAGGDWWRDTTVPGQVGVNNNDIGIGRMRRITASWQLFTFSTIDPRVTAVMSPEPTAS